MQRGGVDLWIQEYQGLRSYMNYFGDYDWRIDYAAFIHTTPGTRHQATSDVCAAIIQQFGLGLCCIWARAGEVPTCGPFTW